MEEALKTIRLIVIGSALLGLTACIWERDRGERSGSSVDRGGVYQSDRGDGGDRGEAQAREDRRDLDRR